MRTLSNFCISPRAHFPEAQQGSGRVCGQVSHRGSLAENGVNCDETGLEAFTS
jgi:hypothetical protein